MPWRQSYIAHLDSFLRDLRAKLRRLPAAAIVVMVMPIPSAVAISWVTGNAHTSADAANMRAGSDAICPHTRTRADAADMSAGTDAICPHISTGANAPDLDTRAHVLGVGGAGRKQRQCKNRSEIRFHDGTPLNVTVPIGTRHGC